MTAPCSLVLRLAAPLQSWGLQTEFNRRETANEPSYSGVLGLLAAAQGRRREDPIVDLLKLRLGVRVDRTGSLLRDYHTVGELDGAPLRSTQVTGKGLQKRTSPAKYTAVTQRFYLQDAAFLAVVEGPSDLLRAIGSAIRHPTFPLALGRRACPPTQPVLVPSNGAKDPLWIGSITDVIGQVSWQESERQRRRHGGSHITLSATIDDDQGEERRLDVPVTFAHKAREFTTRRVTRLWVSVPTGNTGDVTDTPERHDPFALLGW